MLFRSLGVGGWWWWSSRAPQPPAPAPFVGLAAPSATPTPAAPSSPERGPSGTAGTGRVAVTGDAQRVTLVAHGHRFGVGDVPAGDYAIEASFSGLPEVAAGKVHVAAGETTTIRCDADTSRCRAR